MSQELTCSRIIVSPRTSFEDIPCQGLSRITAKLSGKRSPPTQHRNTPILSAPMMGYTSIASQLFIFAIADPLSELEQKTDSP
jgi:hypothetical protein